MPTMNRKIFDRLYLSMQAKPEHQRRALESLHALTFSLGDSINVLTEQGVSMEEDGHGIVNAGGDFNVSIRGLNRDVTNLEWIQSLLRLRIKTQQTLDGEGTFAVLRARLARNFT